MTRLDIATAVETISGVKDQRTLINLSIQIALNRVHQWFDWPYYMQQGVVNTAAVYTTGTAKVTQSSKNVTGVGTNFNSNMTGRKFRHADENAYYVIASVSSGTILTLATPYQGDTDSVGSSYTIYKDEFRLAADVDKYKNSVQIQNGIAMVDVPISTFDSLYPTPQSYADPNIVMHIGTKLDTYSGATVYATANTNTINGNATSWASVEGIGRMSDIIIGTNRYTIKSVNSDTSITTYETILGTIPVGTTYTVIMNNLVLQYYNIPNIQENVNYRYYRIPDVLATDYDVPDMPHQWHWVLIYGSLSFAFLQKGDINKSQIESEARFQDGLAMMKVKLGLFSNNLKFKRKSLDRTPRFLDGLEASNYDIKYSRP